MTSLESNITRKKKRLSRTTFIGDEESELSFSSIGISTLGESANFEESANSEEASKAKEESANSEEASKAKLDEEY